MDNAFAILGFMTADRIYSVFHAIKPAPNANHTVLINHVLPAALQFSTDIFFQDHVFVMINILILFN